MLNVCFPVGGNYGWGIAGLYLSREIAKHTEARVIGIDTIAMGLDDPVIQAVSGPRLTPANLTVSSKTLNVGYAFIENISEAKRNASNGIKYFQHIVAGSTWCAENLRLIGVPNISVAIQGVNTNLFNPHRGRGNRDHRFIIFSGGKLEYRKGQDLVVAAYKNLYRKYTDMHLICSWANIWPQSLQTIRQSTHIALPTHFEHWQRTAVEMMTANGVDSDRYELIDLTNNASMASVYHRADVGVFPNRCEAGTNMVMTEVMACGIPVIATYATGHLDVVAPSHAYCLNEGTYLDDGWFEASIDSIQLAIENAYHRREELREIGRAGAHFIERFTWANSASALIRACSH